MRDRLVGPRLRSSPGLRYAALRAFAAASVGVALARAVELPLPVWVAVALLAVGLTRVTRGFSLYLAVFAAAAGWAVMRAPVATDPGIYRQREFRGFVTEQPLPGKAGRLVVELDQPGRGKVIVWLRDEPARLRYGDELVIAARVREFDYPRNPGLRDRNERLARRGYVGQVSVSAGQLRLTGRNRGVWLMRRLVIPARERLRLQVTRLFPGEQGEVLMALFAGERQGIPGETMSMMRDSGLMHVLAVSGLHVGIVAGIVWFLLGLFGVRGWWRPAVGAIAVIGYVVFVGARPSAVRAGIMVIMAALAWTGQRRVERGAVLGVAGLGLLFIDPGLLFETGTQLSLAAVAGIIVALMIAEQLRTEQLPAAPLLRHSLLFLLRVLAVTVGAFTATAPLLVSEFGQVQLLAIPASPLAVALTGLIVPLGGLAVLLSSIWLPLAVFLAETVGLLLSALTGLAGFTAGIEGTMLRPVAPTALLVPLAMVTLFLLLHWRLRRARFTAVGVILLGMVVSVWASALRPARDRVWLLDPGEGDAMVFETRAGQLLLCDAGIDGPGIVRDFLRYRRSNRVAVAVITHPHRDHYGGLMDLAGTVRIERLVVPTRDGPMEYRQLLKQLQANGTELILAGSGTRLVLGRFRFQFTWPSETARRLYTADLIGANDVSLVAAASYQDYRMMLTGDFEHPELIAGMGDEVDLLKSPHHGSRVGNTVELLESIAPELVVVIGRYPSPAGLEQWLPETGIRYINTRRDGGVELNWPAGSNREPTIRDFRGRVIDMTGSIAGKEESPLSDLLER